MAKKIIRTGTTADPTGDSLKNAFVKVNDNFTELYNALGLDADTLNIGAFEFVGSTMSTTDSSAIVIDQATTITSNLSVGGDILPQTALGGDLGSSTLPWRSLYVSNNTIYIGGTAVGLDANGNLTTGGTVVGSTPAWANITGKPTFATVATTGAYADLTGKPTIPTLVSQLSNDSGFLTSVSNIQSESDVNIEINLTDSTKRIWQFGEDGGLTFPDGYLKIVPNGANPYISNIIDNGVGLVSGSGIQIRQSVADAYGISINSSTTDTSLGDGSLLASGSNIDVNGSKIILGQYVVNNLDADTGLTGQNKIEINNSAILIGLDVSTLTNGTTTSAFSGWTFDGQADTLTFPDSTVQSTAWTGIANALRSETGIYIDVNLSDSTLRRWQFGEDGNLTIPGDITGNNDINITIDNDDSSTYTWNFDQTGDLTAPGDITTGLDGLGGRFIQDCADGTTSMRWINVNQGSSSTQLIRAYTGDPKLNTEVERAQIKLNWDQTEDKSGLTIRTFNQTDPNNEVDHDWLFKGDGVLQLPQGGTITEGGGFTGAIKLTPAGGANEYQALLIYPTAGADGDHIHLTAAGGTTELYLGSDNHYVKLASGGVVRIQADDGVASSAAWVFGTNGELALPNNGKITSGVDAAQVGSTTTIALNSLGTDQANNNINVGIEWTGNEAVFTTYAAGSTITFANGDVRTITEIQKNEVYGEPGVFAIDIYWSTGTPRENLTAFPITLKTSNYAAAYTAPEWRFGTNGSLTFPDNTVQTTAAESFSFSVAADDSTQRAISNNELIKFIGAGGVTTASDAEGNITITGSGGGSSIPTVVTTGAVGEGGAAHAKVQFTVTSATTVTAVGVTVIGISTPASGQITLSGSPGTGSFDIVAATNVQGQTFILMPFATNASGTGYGAPIAGTGTDPCYVKGTMITMADMSRVAVENITYSDDILVWDFDLGEFASAKPLWIKKTQTTVVSCLLTFSDHSILQIVGDSPKAHRIFNKQAGKFTYGSMPETPIGTTTFNDQGEEITLISKEWIVGEVEFYNVMTDYHMNLFANSILTSMRYNNLYPITDMKFVKDSRTLRTANDYPNVEERLYKGFRLAEQTQSVEEIETHIQWLLSFEVERETECV